MNKPDSKTCWPPCTSHVLHHGSTCLLICSPYTSVQLPRDHEKSKHITEYRMLTNLVSRGCETTGTPSRHHTRDHLVNIVVHMLSQLRLSYLLSRRPCHNITPSRISSARACRTMACICRHNLLACLLMPPLCNTSDTTFYRDVPTLRSLQLLPRLAAGLITSRSQCPIATPSTATLSPRPVHPCRLQPIERSRPPA